MLIPLIFITFTNVINKQTIHIMTEEKTKLERVWGYQELALLYFPDSKPECASVQLRRWIKMSGELTSRLEACGWKAGRKVLTPKQVGCIVDHLGEP